MESSARWRQSTQDGADLRGRLPSPSWRWPRLQTGSGMEGGLATGHWRGGGGARTFGLVLVDLDALREELPGEHGGAGQHPGLPRHLVLLHRDLHRVHGWHERHGSSRRPPAHVPHAGLQPSQGGEAAAQSQAAGALDAALLPAQHPSLAPQRPRAWGLNSWATPATGLDCKAWISSRQVGAYLAQSRRDSNASEQGCAPQRPGRSSSALLL